MSTIYGTTPTRDGREVMVDAYGVGGNVKLVIDSDYVGALSFDSAEKVRNLIACLELALAHVWNEGEL